MSLFGPQYKALSDEELMDSIRTGKVRAFDELFSRYGKRMHNYFWRMLGQDSQKAEDFNQDLFLKLIEVPEKFDTNKRFSTWIYTIASNMCKNEYRRMGIRASEDLERDVVIDMKITDIIDNKLFAKQLNAELDLLKPDRKATFVLRYQEELSIKEISEILECSEGTISSRLHYITEDLAKKLVAFSPENKKINVG